MVAVCFHMNCGCATPDEAFQALEDRLEEERSTEGDEDEE